MNESADVDVQRGDLQHATSHDAPSGLQRRAVLQIEAEAVPRLSGQLGHVHPDPDRRTDPQALGDLLRERDLVQTACAFRLFSRELELSLSTRESPTFRNHAFKLGFTAMSAGSKTNPGGYANAEGSLEQFEISDERSAEDVAAFLRANGYEPVCRDGEPPDFWESWLGVFDVLDEFSRLPTKSRPQAQ